MYPTETMYRALCHETPGDYSRGRIASCDGRLSHGCEREMAISGSAEWAT